MELKKKEYGEYVEKITPKNSLPADMARGLSDRRSHLQSGAGYDNGPDVTGRTGKGNGSDVDSAGADFSQHSSDRPESVSQGGKMGRCRGPGTDYRLCQFCCGSSHRIQAEGHVFGIGCKIFTIAGPVILYGIFASWILGLIAWIGAL